MVYTTDTYKLLYYKERINDRGETVRLEVHKRARRADWTPKEIGEFQGLSLEIDGDADPVSPIQKTLLTFNMVDAYDIEDTTDIKHGNWEEFYTPDSTLYMVIVKTKDKGALSFRNRWSGYITPDNWEEELDYRGSITITARDNIGHLQDFDFDMEADVNGTATIKAILETAFSKVALPMDVDLNLTSSEDIHALSYDDVTLASFRVNIEQFKNKTWYDAIEAIMSSLGLCLRYVDDNRMMVTYLRYLPLLGTDLKSEVLERQVMFLNGGSRTLDPAYKKIVEEVNFNVNDSINFDIAANVGSDSQTYQFSIKSSINSGTFTYNGTGVSSKNTDLGKEEGWGDGYGFFNPEGYAISEASYTRENISNGITLLAANSVNDTFTRSFRFGNVNIPHGKITLECLSGAVMIKNFNGVKLEIEDCYVSEIKYIITYEIDNTTYYWEGSGWKTSQAIRTYSSNGSANAIDLDFSYISPQESLAGGGLLALHIISITFTSNTWVGGTSNMYQGIYFALTGISLLTTEENSLSSDTVTTINNETYNVSCERSPELGFLSREVIWQTPQNYLNAIYYINADRLIQPVGYKLAWANEQDNEEPFPILIHRQMLAYHRIASQVLEGECMRTDKKGWNFDEILTYKGHCFLLVKGVYNFLTGRMSSATLREFENYDDLWADTFTVRLTAAGDNKEATIKAIASSAGITVKDAKSITDNVPANIGSGYSRETATSIVDAVTEAGGTTTMTKDL